MKKQLKKQYGLWTIIKPIISEIKVSMFLSSLSALSLIITLFILSLTLNNIIKGIPLVIAGIEFNLINTILLLILTISITFISKFYSFIVSHTAAFRLEKILRTNLSQHLAQIPLGYIITNGSGNLKRVMQDDVKALHAFVADSIPLIAKSIVAPITTLIILLIIDYRFALASIGILLLGGITMSFAMKDSKELRTKYMQSQSDINKAIIEFAQAMPVIRAFDDGTSSFSRYNNALDNFRNTLNKWMQLSSTYGRLGIIILSPLPTLLSILIVGTVFLNSGSINLFAFVLALFLSTGLADAMMPIMWLQNFIKKSHASALRIQEILDEKILEEPKSPKKPIKFDIEFKNVYFKYNNLDNYVLENINFNVTQKSVTALVGPSGAGKSTIAKLIPRFWDIEKGEILIGGINIKNIDSKTLMNTVSFVFQDTFLFADTIFNNIKMANPEAKNEDIINAAKAAQIHNFIKTLPNGYETKAGDRGANFSGGQKQRITIARAILRDTPIIVLDEATAFADPESEEEIIKALANLTKNKTVIMIAHRLSTIKDVDQIIVFDKGQISEIGKHDKLLENKKLYFKLWENYKEATKWNLGKGIENEC
ncbi:ABC transporter ATP-binding protein/permease [Malaciobacter molluscorum]|uniref:ABC transporter ATP-binding protein n=1 Tax=Malaciobacter molluscorum TaxID=1032072 RepID=UPI00100A6358|nr:ABC transporter ATP-binding protein [Malaciobacter molluscorum]RXJ94842.1 ABC transporter ATP-binding protein/permease [Malaciobacter molluscorum]